MIYHITEPDAWAKAQNEVAYRHPSLEQEGFIHLSSAGQLVATANRHFAGHRELVVLAVDSGRLDRPLIWENTSGGIQPYPHVYGPITLHAVVAVHSWLADDEGRFGQPSWLKTR